jgi:hypothetical protein
VEVRTVLSAEDNEILTRVGPGTPMGDLLRRYWIRVKNYPTRESGGIVWTYMGPPEAMTPFRDFGTEESRLRWWR